MEVKFATQLRIIRKKLIATFLVFSHIPTGCALLEHSRKSVSEICWLVGKDLHGAYADFPILPV